MIFFFLFLLFIVSMILHIILDIRYFILILGFALAGFSQAFWLISYPNISDDFGTIQKSFYNIYLYMFVQISDTDFSSTASPKLGALLLVFFLLFILAYFIYQQYIKINQNNLDTFFNSKFSEICTMNLYDIDPQAVGEYNKYNGLIGKTGDCIDSTIKMNINTCKNGESECKQSVDVVKTINLNNITTTKNLIFPKILSPQSVQSYFGYD